MLILATFTWMISSLFQIPRGPSHLGMPEKYWPWQAATTRRRLGGYGLLKVQPR